jgi:hypothetical protein
LSNEIWKFSKLGQSVNFLGKDMIYKHKAWILFNKSNLFTKDVMMSSLMLPSPDKHMYSWDSKEEKLCEVLTVE